MNANNSSARPTYKPTIIESRLLIKRLAVQIAFLNNELKQAWVDFKNDPIVFGAHSAHSLVLRLKKLLSTPNVSATAAVTFLVIMVLMVEKRSSTPPGNSKDESPAEIVLLDVAKP